MNHDLAYLRRIPESDVGKSAIDDVERAVREGHSGVFDILRDLVRKPAIESHVRAALLLQLVAAPSRETERVLVDALAADQPDVVRVRACDALGQVGSEAVLPALEKVAADAGGSLKTQAAFAHVLINHRLRRPSKLFDDVTTCERASLAGTGVAFASRTLTPADRAEILEHLHRGRWKIAPYGHHGLAVDCTGRPWAVLLHDFVVADGLTDTLRRGPSVLGVLARRSEEHQRWSVSRILLGGPREAGPFYIAAYRRDGVLDFYGEGSLGERTVEFNAVKRAGALAISGRAYWHGSVAVIAGIASLTRSPAKAPRPVTATDSAKK